ncbi:MAG: thiol reductant ABC exporter subunit CydD, partial [Nocardioides sp.]|uniref:thiol reductant ABC exporter subunit CydD n=1 Tax=Nocardioides sp. TaxID=35761 RepID=UPI0039E6CF67
MAGPLDPSVRRALAPARRPMGVVVLAGVAGALLLIGQAFAVSRLILAAIGPGAVAPWAGLVVAAFAARALAGWVSDVAAARAASQVGADVRRRVLSHALERPDGRSTGSLIALATRGAAAVEPYLTRYVPALVLAAVLPPLVLAAIAVRDPWSAAIVLLTLPLIPVFGILVGLATRDQADSQWRAMADLAGHFLDVMRGLPTLVAFRRARAQSAVIGAVTDRYRRRTMRTLRIAFVSSAVLELIATLSVAVVAVTIGLRLASGSVSLSVALPVLLLAPEAYWPLRRVGAEFHASAEGLAVFTSLVGPAGAADGFADPGRDEDSAQVGFSSPSAAATRRESHLGGVRASGVGVTLDGVSLTYPGRAVPALAATSLAVSGPGVTALVGPSGCGKSTLLAILGGELVPTTGAARAGAVALTDPAWRTHVAWLPQRPVFLAGSVADNLRIARPDATADELGDVLARVGLDRRLPDVDAGIGEDGLALSAGERARLALARVLLADRPVVLLDEPTAHLDPATEQVIADVVRDLGRTRTVVLVAHRPALLALADHVVELPRDGGDASDDLVGPLPGRVVGLTREGAGSTDGSGEAGTGLTGPGAPTGTPAGATDETRGERVRHGGAWGWVLEGLASACGVALTATAGWLIVRASTQPGVLTLTVAIVGVRAFGIARPVLRYAERLVAHDRALRLLARTRVGVYDALVPLVPGRLGRRRGDLLASVVDDVDAVLDRELRVRIPVGGFVLTGILTTAVATVLDPRAGLVVALLAAVAGPSAFALARRGAEEAERRAVTARAVLSERVADAVQAADELR